MQRVLAHSDLGYAFGAIISGITADFFGVKYAIVLIGGITIISALIIHFRMPALVKASKDCIDVEEVKNAIQANKKVLIIDVRSKEEYERAHIPNALNISIDELKRTVLPLDRAYQYITVCGKGGGRSADGAKLLRALGLNAIWLCGGTYKWLSLND